MIGRIKPDTLRTAFQRLARYAYVVDIAVGFELADDNGRLSLVLTTENPCSFPKTPAEEDASWAFVMSLCRASYGEQMNPVEVRLQHEELGCQGEYDRFFLCPVLLNMVE